MAAEVIRIRSENSHFLQLQALARNRHRRHRERQVWIEGVRAIDQALAHGWPLVGLVHGPPLGLSDWARGVLAAAPRARRFELTPRLMERLSEKTETSELLAVAAMPPDDLSRLPTPADLCLVVFDRPASPGNLGTLIRSCDALGAHGLVITGHAVDLYDPETIRATTGSFFAVPSLRVPSHKELLPWLASVRERLPGLQLVGTSAAAARDAASLDLRRPTVWLLGNETHGLSQAWRDAADALVKIPIGGSATSLNVAVAGSILLHETGRQRRA